MNPNEVVAVNDNADFSTGGDVSVYSNAKSAAKNIEPDDLMGDKIHVIRGDGRRLFPEVCGDHVALVETDDLSDNSDVLREWLHHMAVVRINTAPVRPNRDASLEELIAFIGLKA